jgi:adsorption protein B
VWFDYILTANIVLMGNRMLQRIIFVSGYYGVKQGLLSIPRLLWGNLINFLANWRAIRQIIKCGDPRRVAWDKTTHDFPSISGDNHAKRSLEEILVANGMASEQALHEAELHRIDGLQLGSSMVHEGRITAAQLACSIAEQIGVSCESVDPTGLPRDLLGVLPARTALHYAILPLRHEGRTLVLASECYIDPVSLAAIARQLGRPVRYVIAHKGQVTVGLRRWYAHACDHDRDPHHLLDIAARSGHLHGNRVALVWDSYVSRQVMLGEILVAQGHLDEVAFRSLLLSHARTPQPLGEFLIERGAISREILDRMLVLQAALQPSIANLLLREVAVSAQLATPTEQAA